MFADVFVAKPLATPYSYLVPPELEPWVGPGSRVLVPLGRTQVQGVVVAVSAHPPAGTEKVRFRPIARVLESPPALSAELLELGREVAGYYLCAPGEAYQAMVPSYAPPAPAPRFGLGAEMSAVEAALGGRARRQLEVAAVVAEAGTRGAARSELGDGADAAIRALLARGLLRKVGDPVYRLDPGHGDGTTPAGDQGAGAGIGGAAPGRGGSLPLGPELTEEQREAFGAIEDDGRGGRAAVHLLHGVTGSGKTEIYLAAIRAALERGRGAIFLVPEIALTVPMIRKVRERFGEDLAVLHSAMATRERWLEWARVRSGRARVVLGPRSAVFAPVVGLGLVVIDEEQEGSYKQQDKPRYHAREVALWRARREGFPVVLGSATPTLESYHRAREGEFRYHRLERRFRQDAMPPVRLVDMAEEFAGKRNRSIFSMELKERLGKALERGGQALLFMNRRGFHTYVFCRACGFVLECRSCSVALTYHFQGEHCLCHHCGFKVDPPAKCPGCQGGAIRYAGTGTQRIEAEFAVNFPGVRFDRMDSDTTRRKGSHERIFEAYARGETRVLIGTQMVAKGFDFPNLNLVGVVNADMGLSVPDFRGAERTFQTITQVAGRAGRGDDPGEVVVQTYQPGHYALEMARRHDYAGFAERELPIRRELFYPPYSRLVLALSEEAGEEAARAPLEALRTHLETSLGGRLGLRILGPAPAPLMRIEGRHRWQLLVKVEPGAEAMAELGRVLREAPEAASGVKLDVDPMHLL